ncbi:MAG TPA: fructosamine kinase family protein [Burkholderiales bacterium]|nr:fructosamine kinase family protein [Burkholderiales bacterium]
MNDWAGIARDITAARGRPFAIRDCQPLSGGCINRAWRVGGDDAVYFVKLNAADRLTMFEAEAAGLDEIARSRTVRVPRPVTSGADENASWLVLEYIELASGGDMARLGEQLAKMHRVNAAQFGWRRDNTIGATPHINTPNGDWLTFWRERRLGYQLALAARNGHGGALQRDGEQLIAALPTLLGAHHPQPALLHGDLWGGNAGFDAAGMPVIFDPAVYYGDRETDIAMTELFGSFSAAFYAAYRSVFPLDPGYETRKLLYNLYHVLNHANLFGGGYPRQAEHMIGRLLAEL